MQKPLRWCTPRKPKSSPVVYTTKLHHGRGIWHHIITCKREKKAKLKAKIKDKERKEKLVAKLNPGLGNKYSKEKALKQLEDAEKQGHVINLNKKNKDTSVKTSKSFFTNLQDEVKTQVREKAASKKSKDKNNKINPASLKL